MESVEGMLVVDRRGEVRTCSGTLARVIGRRAADLAGLPVWSLLTGWNPFGKQGAGAFRLSLSHGSIPVDLSWEVLHLPGETLFMIEVRGRDCVATHDGLTGLANRSLFLDRLGHLLRRASLREEAFTLAIADIDRFKDINRGFGHSTGDALLQAVAGRLRQCVREADTVSRLGGDEFGLILAGAGTREAAAKVLGDIVALSSAPVRLERGAIAAKLSVGACLFPADGTDADELRGRADSAMHAAKRAGGAAFRFFRRAPACPWEKVRADA
jgi:diguanylate cyclase (GGDEF)-like protein